MIVAVIGQTLFKQSTKNQEVMGKAGSDGQGGRKTPPNVVAYKR